MNVHPDPTIFIPLTPAMRRRIKITIENLEALLQEVDGDGGEFSHRSPGEFPQLRGAEFPQEFGGEIPHP